MYYVYMLKSWKDDKLYIGYTKDLKNRIEQHNNGETFSTSFRKPLKLVYYEAYLTQKCATQREHNLKQFGSSYGHLKKRAGLR